MNTIDSSQLLSQLREFSELAKGLEPQGGRPEQGDFSKLLGSAVDKVNETQHQAGKLKKAFELGDPSVSLPEVMVASQKAGLSFQALLQVRNKMVSAYQEIMRMQV